MNELELKEMELVELNNKIIRLINGNVAKLQELRIERDGIEKTLDIVCSQYENDSQWLCCKNEIIAIRLCNTQLKSLLL